MTTYVFIVCKISLYTGSKTGKGVWTMLDANVVGSVLQRLREERGLSQEIVSGLAGIGRTHLSAIERGERKPTLETFYRIGEALHMRPSAVLAEIETELETAHKPV